MNILVKLFSATAIWSAMLLAMPWSDASAQLPHYRGRVLGLGQPVDETGKVITADGACREILFWRGPSAIRRWGCWKDPKEAPAIGTTAHIKGITTGVHPSRIGVLQQYVPVVGGIPQD
jgi:hypothetical protein